MSSHLSITERGIERRYEVKEAAMLIRRRTDDEQEIQALSEDWVAIEMRIDTVQRKEGQNWVEPSLSIGPIFRKLDSPAALTGTEIWLSRGYDFKYEKPIGTLYFFEHHTLGEITIRFGKVDERTAEIEIEASSPDTDCYDARARRGITRAIAQATVSVPAFERRP